MTKLQPYFKVLFIFFVLQCLIKNATAQKYDRIFKLGIKRTHLSFKAPKGFSELDSITIVKCDDGKFPVGTVIYSLINKDSSVVIAFNNLMSCDTTRYDPIKNTRRYDPIQNVRLVKKNFADTINHTAFFYPKEYSIKKFNADIAGEFTRNCPNPFMQKYHKNRFIFLAKADYGEASIIYYYNEDREKDIHEIIKQTAGMLRFKN